MKLVGRTGWARGPASSVNWRARKALTSLIRWTAAPRWSAEKLWSRNTVNPSLRHSWNQSRQVMRSPVQLWKYSWATTLSIRS